MKPRLAVLVAVFALAAWAPSLQPAGLAQTGMGQGLRFRITLDPAVTSEPLTGRVYVVVSREGEDEPRFQVDVTGVPFWGKDVANLRPGGRVDLGSPDPTVYGYPFVSTKELPAGDYYVQAFMNIYTTFRRADGSVVQLFMPCGDGHDIFSGTGNLYSDVRRLHLEPNQGTPIPLRLSNVIPPPEPVPPGETCQQGNPPDSEHVKHVKIQSPLLTEFWGQPMYIGANVLLPEGYDDHPNVRYPVVYLHGHFPFQRNPYRFREDLGNSFSRWWVSAEAPRVIVVEFRHENPYYDDSYAVNSPNLGPYGDALTQELMPEIDAQFRTIAEPWARMLTGGSTGGWESFAQMVWYPELYAGVWSLCPDPVDFRYHQIVNVYSEPNAFWTEYEWMRVERPSARRPDGNIRFTIEDENHWELALGDHSRSGAQWDIWEAAYGPQGPDGYPARIWDKRTGEIDHAVAEQWRDKDIRYYLETNWSTIGPDFVEKIHIYTGDDDTYYLEEAVKLLEQFLDSTTAPPAQAEIVYGPDRPHCWSPYTTPELIQVMVDFITAHAPPGADTTSWKY